MMVWSHLLGLLLFYGMQFANGQATDISKAMIDTGLKLLKIGDKSGNTFFSPMGISYSMGMLYTGAKGDTQSQIGRYLFSGLTVQAVNDQLKALTDKWDKEENSFNNVPIANRLYVQAKYPVLLEYTSTLNTSYKAEIKSVDFKNNAESARQEINSYVEDQTNHKIKDLFAAHSLDKAIMVLVNALYYKGTWKNKFNVSETSKKPFSSNENDRTMVDMMSMSDADLYYNGHDDEVQVLGLPFIDEPNGDEVIAYIILPLERFGLGDAIKNMNTDRFQNLIKNAKKRTIQRVEIPKFKLDMEFQSHESFKILGVTDAFSPDKADFSGIDGFHNLYASNIIHKVSLEFSEEGVEAIRSSATAATEREFLRFSVDQPFMLAIIEKSSSVIMFMGHLSKLA